jgi:hypothetical protein
MINVLIWQKKTFNGYIKKKFIVVLKNMYN